MIDPLVQGVLAAATFMLSLKLTGDHTSQTPWWRRLAGIGYGTFGLWLGGMLLSANVGVVRDAQSTLLSRGPTWAIMSMYVHKVRSGCEFEFTRASVVNVAGLTAKAWWEALDDPAPGSTRPVGKQWMGDWRVRWDGERFKPVAVLFETHHNCGMLGGDVITTTGPFPLGEVTP